MKRTIWITLLFLVLLVAGIIGMELSSDSAPPAVIQVRQYAITDFEVLLAAKPKELRHVEIKRKKGTDLWEVSAKDADVKNNEMKNTDAVQFLVSWGKQQADARVKHSQDEGLVSYESACVVHSLSGDFK